MATTKTKSKRAKPAAKPQPKAEDYGQFRNLAGILSAVKRAQRNLIPPPVMLPSVWAEKNIKIPTGNAVPGPYRIHNAPYQREPMDMLVQQDCYRVTLMWGAQVGKTLLALCVQAYCIGASPRSHMMMQPSENDLGVWLETKFNPLAEDCSAVADALGQGKVDNKKMKGYPGGFLMFAWAGSPKTMRGRSAPTIVCDEVDGYERTNEGHPVSLLWQRSATFGDIRFLMDISTPTIKGESYIEKSFEAGDQRRFYVPCPHCESHVLLEWEHIHWPGRMGSDEENAKALDEMEPEKAHFHCPDCGAQWTDGQRIAAIRKAESVGAGWKATRPFTGHASYHLNELYSTFRKIPAIVRDYIDKLKTDDLQTFYNVSLALTWDEKGESADPDSLMARREIYSEDGSFDVPAGGLYLTAGIDMQIDRLECEVVAWGLGEESWSLGYWVFWGDPLTGDPWDQLDDLLESHFIHETGAKLRIMGACLDTGGTNGMTSAAYAYAKGRTGRRLFAIKGVPGWGKAVAEKPSRRQSGKDTRKVDLWPIAVDEGKLIVTRRLNKTEAGPGYCHFPDDRHEEWFNQLTAEKMVTKYVRGQPVREWKKPDRARNEALDCRVYAYAALKITAPRLLKIAQRLGIDTTGAEPERRKRLKTVPKMPKSETELPQTATEVPETPVLASFAPQPEENEPVEVVPNAIPHNDKPATKKQNRPRLQSKAVAGKKAKKAGGGANWVKGGW